VNDMAHNAAHPPDSGISSEPRIAVPAEANLPRLPRRDAVLILVSIVLITVLAWLFLVHLSRQMGSAMRQDQMMAAMGMPMDKPWTATDLFFTFAMWAVMMAGMMGPSAAPMVLLFAAVQSRSGSQRTSLSAGSFGLGYVFVWTLFSVGAAMVQWALHTMSLLSPAMAVPDPRIGGAVLVAAGLYQMTPWKNACLTHCLSPLNFLMTHWREGKLGAFGIGVQHGVYCLGCCWALMIILFAVGVMNLAWVAALTVIVLLERIGPYGKAIAKISGAALIIYGIVLIA
jgi:predicted metal-binding membrane protein